ncbi:CBS domain-containing protein [Streptomyces sp. UNOB3_S3]|uniref:CBS domain-containing protein n=1 Tax=Streptomyces sp. UNOB3_S3 TaxID=2871682 RepID=UPI001E3B12D5|nr:CBS domain-containing protein [Streptomyces sp. UNOB3_S3]MCC3778677.1 CBS domain-containing protein [Streptomyces sp. UNOB3_S3]
MTRAKDIMHEGAQWITRDETLSRAAQVMEMLNVGALPVSNDEGRLCGIITDRDIVVKCLAQGRDPAKVRAGELCEGTPRWIDANADVDDVLHEMESHRIRRLPVIENKRLVGMISEADVARHLPDDKVAELVGMIYSPAK